MNIEPLTTMHQNGALELTNMAHNYEDDEIDEIGENDEQEDVI